MNKIKLVIIYICFFSLTAVGQNARAVMENVQTKFSKTDNFAADFFQSAASSGLNSSFKMSGKFYYKKTNRFKIESEKLIIVSNGETIWNYNKDMDRVVINNVSDDPSAFSIENYIYEYPKNCELKLINTKNPQTVIRLIPKNSTIPFNYIDLSVNQNWLIEKIELLDLSNSKIIVELQNIKINTNLSNQNFEFTPPEGSNIIDFR